MTSLALLLHLGDDGFAAVGLWAFLAIGAIALFVVFLPTVSWIDARRKEREAYYRTETIRRLTESSSEGAKAAVDLLREEARLQRIKKLEGLKIGGLTNLGIGIALVIFMSVMFHGVTGPALVGLVPAFMGVALLVYVFFMAKPVE